MNSDRKRPFNPFVVPNRAYQRMRGPASSYPTQRSYRKSVARRKGRAAAQARKRNRGALRR